MYRTTIVLCTYNGEKYLENLMESLCQQTRKADEIIVSDDGSTDNTLEIIQRYKNNFLNLKIIKNKPSKGAPKNFVDTALLAQGDVVFFCDQDDVWTENKIENMTNQMEKNREIYLLSSSLKPIYEKNVSIVSHFVLKKQANDGKLYKVPMTPGNINIKRSGCTMCFRKTLLEEAIKYWIPEWYHDDFIWKCAVLTNTAFFLDEITVYRRIHNSNASIGTKIYSEDRIQKIDKEIDCSIQAGKYANDKVPKEEFSYTLKKFIKFQEERKEVITNQNWVKYLNLIRKNGGYFRTKAQIILDGRFVLFKRT